MFFLLGARADLDFSELLDFLLVLQVFLLNVLWVVLFVDDAERLLQFVHSLLVLILNMLVQVLLDLEQLFTVETLIVPNVFVLLLDLDQVFLQDFKLLF